LSSVQFPEKTSLGVRKLLSRRSVILTVVSLAAGIAVLVLLVAMAHVDPQTLFARLLILDRFACVRFTLWMALNIYLSSVKWRLTDDVLRSDNEQPVSGELAFTSTAFGVALGQLLPAAIGMSTARTLASSLYGRALRRGTFGTLFEQSFDLLAVGVLAIPSVVILTFHRSSGTWLALAIPMSLGVVWMVGKLLDTLNNIDVEIDQTVRWKRTLADIKHSGLMRGALGRKLMMVAFARFVLVVLAAGETTAAIHAAIPLGYLAVAMPLGLLAMVTGVTPGGIGIVEFTYVGMLHLLGIPFSVATEWALAARVLSITSAFVITASSVTFLMLFRLPAALRSARAADSA
jgi:hypothetical protein